MSLYHAVAAIDHQSAEILQFGSEHVLERTLHQHIQLTRQHHSGVRSEHEFFAQVCQSLDGIAEVLVVGGHTSLADFRHYVDKHQPLTAKRIVAYQVADRLSENQLVALARQYFVKYDQFVGIRVPT